MKIRHRTRRPGYLLIVVAAAACASSTPTNKLRPGRLHPASFASQGLQALASEQDQTDLARLVALRDSRTRGQSPIDYPIGPGDVLEISVPSVAVMRDRRVRVSSESKIALPLVGVLAVGGITEAQLRQVLRLHLQKYMYDPQVDVFVKEYRSRAVAVVGAIQKPGLYSLNRPSDTLLDVITQAGGVREDAADRILFFAAEGESEPHSLVVAPRPGMGPGWETVASSPHASVSVGSRPGNAMIISLRDVNLGSGDSYLNLPARPGDVVIVPVAGSVMVEGWVHRPGAIRITPGLTVLGAIAAAGGPLFAAKTNSVTIIRSGRHGEKIFLHTDLDEIALAREPDVAVQQNDVIEVTYSKTAVVPYMLYTLFNRFAIGAGVPIAP